MSKVSDSGVISLSSRVRHRAVGNEGVLVHLQNGRVVVVNEVGLHIIGRLAQPTSRGDLVEFIATEFEASPEQAAADLDSFLAELNADQLLEVG